jgi:predicted aminopeptidase
MTRRPKPSVPQNIQALINANETYAASVSQAKANQSLSNETKFREEHSGFIHKAEVRRNIRRSREEAALARLDFILDRRAQLAQLFAEERAEWDALLQRQSRAIYRKP